MTEYHSQGGLNNRNFLTVRDSLSPRLSADKVGCWHGLCSFLAVDRRPLLCPHMALPRHVPGERASGIFLALKGHQSYHIRTLRPHFTLMTSLKAPSPNTVTLGGGISVYEILEGRTSYCI